MKHPPPILSLEAFSARVTEAADWCPSKGVAEALYAHFQELLRWNRRLSLIGPGTLEEIPERHFGESLQALPWIPLGARVVDVGSGGGFPGLVLAIARPDLLVTLVESQQAKWAFLRAAARASGASVSCIHDRMGPSLPAELEEEQIDSITLRAVRLPPPVWSLLVSRLSERGRVLIWAGLEEPALPSSLRRLERVPLTGSQRRQLLVYGRSTGG